jgi:hypothetical protein
MGSGAYNVPVVSNTVGEKHVLSKMEWDPTVKRRSHSMAYTVKMETSTC